MKNDKTGKVVNLTAELQGTPPGTLRQKHTREL